MACHTWKARDIASSLDTAGEVNSSSQPPSRPSYPTHGRGPSQGLSLPHVVPAVSVLPNTGMSWPETIFRTAKFNCPGHCTESPGVPPKHLPWHHPDDVDAREVAWCFIQWSQGRWRRGVQLIGAIRAETTVLELLSNQLDIWQLSDFIYLLTVFNLQDKRSK